MCWNDKDIWYDFKIDLTNTPRNIDNRIRLTVSPRGKHCVWTVQANTISRKAQTKNNLNFIAIDRSIDPHDRISRIDFGGKKTKTNLEVYERRLGRQLKERGSDYVWGRVVGGRTPISSRAEIPSAAAAPPPFQITFHALCNAPPFYQLVKDNQKKYQISSW